MTNTKSHARAVRCPKEPTRVDRMRRKLKTKVGKAVYAARKAIVEPVFGQIKQARGFRQFLLRGIEKVRGEWSLVCLTHNISEDVPDLLRVRSRSAAPKSGNRERFSRPTLLCCYTTQSHRRLYLSYSSSAQYKSDLRQLTPE